MSDLNVSKIPKQNARTKWQNEMSEQNARTKCQNKMLDLNVRPKQNTKTKYVSISRFVEKGFLA